MTYSRSLPLLTLMIGLAATPFAKAETLVEGPVVADVIRVVDGDTLLVTARPWPQQSVEVFVRLRGIDTAELKSKCDTGRQAAEEAKRLLEDMAARSPQVKLSRIAADKYFGRIVADVSLADGRDPAREILQAGLATPYSGKGRKNDLCVRS
ncbi:thermonuclease family protein [Rhizobium sp. SGZ-381]|uniref:thermonuclease family protein n=1 Tax=Rhizobium sp. SGZ-381 TaxID=3342800 RepID=UPI00366BDCF6